jgi:anti-sigma B factor antagonist
VAPGRRSRFQKLPDRVHAAHLEGELDGAELAAFEIEAEAAIHRGELAVVIDLRDAAFVGSAVVNAVFRVCRKLRQVGGALAIVCTDPQALRVIQVTGLDKAVAVHDDFDEAVRAVEPHRSGFR